MRGTLTLAAILLLTGCGGPPKPAAPQPRITAGSTLDCGRLLRHVRPVYPPEARRQRIQGVVTLEALVTRRGEVTVLRVVKGNPFFVEAAFRAAIQWRYSPCVLNGEPVEFKTTLEIPFTLSQ